MNNLVYEDTAKYDFWLKIILGSVLALTLTLGVILSYENIMAALTMFGVTIFDALLFRAILPQRFQILEDRLKIVLGGPFSINIALSDITEVRSASGKKAFVYQGIRFATSFQHIVEIVRKKGLNLVISPTNPDTFIEQLNQAREELSR